MRPLNAAQQILDYLGAPHWMPFNEGPKPGKAARRKANKIAARSRRTNRILSHGRAR